MAYEKFNKGDALLRKRSPLDEWEDWVHFCRMKEINPADEVYFERDYEGLSIGIYISHPHLKSPVTVCRERFERVSNVICENE